MSKKRKDYWELRGSKIYVRRATFRRKDKIITVGVGFLRDWGYLGDEVILMKRKDGVGVVYECDVVEDEERFLEALNEGELLRKLYKGIGRYNGGVREIWTLAITPRIWSRWWDRLDFDEEDVMFIFKRGEGKKFELRVEKVLKDKKQKNKK